MTRANGALLNAFFVALPLENALYENPGRVDFIGVEGAFWDQFLDLCNGDFAGHGHHGVEIAGRGLVDQVARRVPFPRFDKCEVCGQGAFQNVGFAIELPDFLALRHFCSKACRREKCGDARTTGAAALGQRALGNQVHFQFSTEHLAFKLVVLTDVGADHFADLALLQEQTQAKIIHPGVVRDARQIVDFQPHQFGNAALGNATQSEAAQHERHARLDPGTRSCAARYHF